MPIPTQPGWWTAVWNEGRHVVTEVRGGRSGPEGLACNSFGITPHGHMWVHVGDPRWAWVHRVDWRTAQPEPDDYVAMPWEIQ